MKTRGEAFKRYGDVEELPLNNEGKYVLWEDVAELVEKCYEIKKTYVPLIYCKECKHHNIGVNGFVCRCKKFRQNIGSEPKMIVIDEPVSPEFGCVHGEKMVLF